MSTPDMPDPTASEEVTVHEVAAWLATGGDACPVVIDCREAEELEICKIDGAKWIPLGEFPIKLESIRQYAGRGVVVSCHHGMRSLRAARFLRQHGIERAYSMAGGIDAWSLEVDPGVPRY